MTTAATIKTSNQDFIVDELIDFPLTGDGEHLWCYVEKSAMNTAYLQREWARLLNCPVKLISHSGLKDRHAVTRQWLCLPAKQAVGLPEQGENWRIISRSLHQKKLRIGTHRRNAFTLRLRALVGDHAEIEARLSQVAERGFANAFGAQRFGRNNLDRAQQWVARGVLPKKRDERAQTLSTLRAHLFNLELHTRLAQDCAFSLCTGDQAMLTGSHSHFTVEAVTDDLRTRCTNGDIAPAGLLAGKMKQAEPDGVAQAIRAQAYRGQEAVVAYLQQHCDADYRALVVRPTALRWQWLADDALELHFTLPRGSFATALLDAVFDTVVDAAAAPRG